LCEPPVLSSSTSVLPELNSKNCQFLFVHCINHINSWEKNKKKEMVKKDAKSYNIERYQRGVDRMLNATGDIDSGASEIADRGKRKLSRKVSRPAAHTPPLPVCFVGSGVVFAV
jgi:hypothetical protein